MARVELDLTKLTALCGDFSVHVLSKLEGLKSGERLVVKVRKDDKDLLEAAVSVVRDAGIAKLVEEGEEGEMFYVILEKQR